MLNQIVIVEKNASEHFCLLIIMKQGIVRKIICERWSLARTVHDQVHTFEVLAVYWIKYKRRNEPIILGKFIS